MPWPPSTCSSCRRPATLVITGRTPGRSYYAALSCTACAPRHREKARAAGPLVEEPYGQPNEEQEQAALF
ncbi:hypothetical protein ACFYY8_33705 [Streptosporangium sp. NPDC001559]|uniref:hypothetical protein n=1 Tax=Streptosporangium sp. NPDC001559 TaxID=3366187 RepID=UPI0036E82216